MKGNIFDKRGIVPPSLDREQGREVFETLLSRPLPEGQPLRVERIMSFGQEHGMWYDQSWDEWVMVMRGEAALEWGGWRGHGDGGRRLPAHRTASAASGAAGFVRLCLAGRAPRGRVG